MRILLAVSGGIDSMCMAHMAMSGKLMSGSEFGIAHCNFTLRGEESDGDELLVANMAGEAGIPFYSIRFETESYATRNGLSIEMAARELRYKWFADICLKENYDAVAVAHNADDNAETLLLNMLRGTGPRGMRGLASESVVPVPGCTIALLRPLLGMSRKDIEDYAAHYSVAYRNDRTNADKLYKRNRLRHDVLPVFGDLNPSFLKTFRRNMQHVAQENDIADDWFNSIKERFIEKNGALNLAALKGIRHWEYALFRAIEPWGANEEILDNIIDLINSGRTFSGKVFHTAKGTIITSTGRIEFVDRPTELPSFSVEYLKRSEIRELRQAPGTIILDADLLPRPLVIRKWEDGDYMYPLGLRGRKKISDLLTNLHYSLAMKDRAMVVATNEKSHVAALLCERIDERFKVSDKTGEVVRISLL